MKVFIWKAIDYVSDNYHNGGGLVVIAESLEKARELLSTASDAYSSYSFDQGGRVPDTPVPSTCKAFTVDPDLVIETTHEKEEIFIFPDAGCC